MKSLLLLHGAVARAEIVGHDALSMVLFTYFISTFASFALNLFSTPVFFVTPTVLALGFSVRMQMLSAIAVLCCASGPLFVLHCASELFVSPWAIICFFRLVSMFSITTPLAAYV